MFDIEETMKNNELGIVFIGGFPPAIARLAEYNYEVISAMAKKLVKHRVKIYILANKDGTSSVEEFNYPSNIKVLRVWQKDNTLRLLLELVLMRRRADILLISYYHGVFGSSAILNFLSTLLILILGRMLRYKVLVVLHTLPELRKTSLMLSSRFFNHVYHLGFTITTLLIFKASHRVVLLVKIYRDVVCSMLPSLCSKIRYIPHGVPNYVYCSTKALSASSKIKVAFIGLLSSRKNLLALVEALSNVSRSLNSNTELVLIGAPHPYLPYNDLFTTVKRAVEKGISIKYIGYLPTKELQEYVCRYIDVVVLPYKLPTGTSGIAHFIASAATPIVVPSFVEFVEMYKDGHGLVFFNKNREDVIAELSKVIYNVLTNEVKYHELSKRAVNYAKTHEITLTSLLLIKEVVHLYKGI
jgi:glycosyltransferase involved in cell wall biosynthesis